MAKQSLEGLFNLSEVSKIVKKADTVYWYIDENGANVVSDSHVIFRFYGVCEALFTRFQKQPGSVPLNSSKGREAFEAPQLKSCFEKFLTEEQTAEVHDTRLTFEQPQGNTVRILYAQAYGEDKRSYIYLATNYFSCIRDYVKAEAVKTARAAAVTFSAGNEKAVILPVNIQYEPSCMVEL